MRLKAASKLALPFWLLAASGLSGCAAVAIPIVAGGALVARTADGPRAEKTGAAPNPPAAAAAPVAADKVAGDEPAIRPEVPLDPATNAAASASPALATSSSGAAPQIEPDGATRTARLPLASLQLTSFDPAFALMAERALEVLATHERAAASDEDAMLLSALLADPVALDGKRKTCPADQSRAVLIDLDPAGAVFTPPVNPTALPEHAAVLASLREAGIIIGWVSQSSITATGSVRDALEQSGLDPRGQDVLLLIGTNYDRKQTQREGFGQTTCVIAIAGDERADFDERFRYLRNPAEGAGLDRLIGDVWHFVRPIFPSTSSTGNPTP